MTTPRLLTKDEAAERLRISTRRLSDYLARGDGPITTRYGWRVFVREDHLAAYIDACAVMPTKASASDAEVG